MRHYIKLGKLELKKKTSKTGRRTLSMFSRTTRTRRKSKCSCNITQYGVYSWWKILLFYCIFSYFQYLCIVSLPPQLAVQTKLTAWAKGYSLGWIENQKFSFFPLSQMNLGSTHKNKKVLAEEFFSKMHRFLQICILSLQGNFQKLRGQI